MHARSMVVLAMTVIAGLGLLMIGSGRASEPQGKKDPNKQDAPKDAKDSAQIKFVKDIELAHQLICYGRQEKHAESLLVAAQILHKTPTEPLTVGSTVSGPGSGMPAKGGEKISPKALVAEAKKMASTPQVEALAMATEKMLQEAVRGAIPGPRRDNFSIAPGQTITWKPITFRGNEKAVVDIEYIVNGRMTLEIIDENGVIVARDSIPDHYVNCTWYPKWTGPFTVRLTNNDTLTFFCDLLTN